MVKFIVHLYIQLLVFLLTLQFRDSESTEENWIKNTDTESQNQEGSEDKLNVTDNKVISKFREFLEVQKHIWFNWEFYLIDLGLFTLAYLIYTGFVD
ncbi:hypothetical protein J6590_073958 [Homalodisca vitripennis]|nr:hypothetical protein J6590_073958 [Homalodisca vitripennis]